jgi:leucyl-tRNA synthetase
MAINFGKIEKKWQNKWEKKKAFEVKEGKKKKFYVLEMFPYPSGSGLHMGHAFNYTIGDIYARFKRMQGFNVLYPMGYDSLGLPAENAAIKEGKEPKKYIERSIKNFIKQQKELGFSYDWKRLVMSHNPEYYKWDQWIFLKMLEKGLAFRKKSSVNYCRKCDTVLANEQVHDGKCWRHTDTEVEVKQLEQWFFKITAYAPELYDVEKLKGWPEDVKAMQKNWIGESFGVEINFKINNGVWPIFTTRPDTIYGVTFMVVSAQHPRLMELVTDDKKEEVKGFLKKIKSVSEKELEDLEKEGVFTGSYAINPLTKEKIPVYVGNFVVADYGSGMVMAVPAHDYRDYDFAKKYNLPIKEVVKGGDIGKEAFVGEGKLINSGNFSGISSEKAIQKISDYTEKNKLGRRSIQYRLKDWLISRQRYWGTPIPIIYCEKCGIVPVPEKDLPVKLPERVKFGKGNPLETAEKWKNVKCPKCGGKGKRETDTMDTFVNSSWYFLRYCDVGNKKKIFDKKKAAYWMPIDQYIGGKEHACMHLIYFRFYTKFLRDIGLLKVGEPALKLFNQGMVCGPDGAIMSKSRGNVVNPIDVTDKYGTDALRLYLISTALPDKDFIWNDKAIQGSLRFINKVVSYFSKIKFGKIDKRLESRLNKTIIEITSDIENFKYNLAVIKLRNLFESFGEIDKKTAEVFLKLLSPFCPHIAEELWEKIKGKGLISLSKWPEADKRKINKKFELEEKAREKLKEDINHIKRITGKKKAKVYIYVLPKELSLYDSIEGVKVFSVNDPGKYDPKGKSKKAKPGKPAIYLE